MNLRTVLKGASAPIALAVALNAPTALAQDADGAAVSSEQDAGVIVVTGSRIASDSTTALASPVTVVSDELIKKSGDVEIAQILREIPALQGSDPSTLDVAQGFAATGASTLDLRQLGSERTLVLQDGRRHVPGISGTATVDVASIPTALIADIEVLTGGASGVYGADAVSGVVNFKTRTGRDFDGLEYRFQTGISDEGDSEEFYGSVAGGGTFADGRGSAVFAIEYTQSEGIRNGDRPNFAGVGATNFDESNAFFNNILGLDPASENAFIPNQSLPVSSAGGSIAIDPGPNAEVFGAVDSFAGNFNPETDTVPFIDGTTIPIVQIFDPATGELRAFNPGFSISPFNAIGGDSIFTGPAAPFNTLIPDQKRFNAAAGFDYELTETITFFADAKFAFSQTDSVDGIPFADDLFFELDNPLLPAALQAQIPIVDALSDETPSIRVARDNVGSDTGAGSSVERSTIRATGGLRWESPDSNVSFELSYGWGRTDIDAVSRNTRINDRYFTAIDAVALTQDNIDDADSIFAFANGTNVINAIRDGQDISIGADTAQVGDIVCRSEVTGLPAPANLNPFIGGFVGGPPVFEPENEVTINGVDVTNRTRPVTFQIGDGQCAPVNVFGASAIQGAGANFAFVDLEDDTVIEQQQFLAVLAGDTGHLFELPGGPIGFAAGFEYRRDESQFVPAAFRAIEGRVVENATVPVFASPSAGQGITVFEGFGELRLPLLEGLPFVDYLEVSASGRISDYNTIGSTDTYSFGAIYRPVDWITLRGTLSRAVRAPNIGELFAPVSAAFIAVGADPCDDGNIENGSASRQGNCALFVEDGFDSAEFLTAFVTGTTSGNPLLTEETSDSFTIGGVIQPRGVFGGVLDNLVLIVDYYDIEIEDAVDFLTGAQVAAACVDLPSIDNQFCDAIDRNPDNGNAISGFTTSNINISELRASGIDFEARYSFDAPFEGDWGEFTLSARGTHFIERFTESDPVIAQTIAAEPDPLQQELLIADQATVSDLLGVIGNPDWIVNFGVNWDFGKWSLGWRGRFEDSALNFSNSDATDVAIVDGAVVVSVNEGFADPSQFTTGSSLEHDISVSYQATDNVEIYGGVNNLTDREPFLGSLVRPVSPRGRFFFIGVSGGF